MVKIDKKIRGYSVKSESAPQVEEAAKPVDKPSNVVQMHESLERPEALAGYTIKIKSAALEHALYLTVNHIVLNEGTSHEVVRPFEVFISTKDPNSQPWIVALTRLLSAVFRKGGDFAFVLEELKSVHDPKGGCFLPGGVYVPSTVAHIGMVLEQHLEEIGAMKPIELSPEVKALIESKKAQLQERTGGEGMSAVPGAGLCPKCSELAVVTMDGCSTCLTCGHSKCG